MEQDHVPVGDVFHHCLLNGSRVLNGPVLWVHRPIEDCQIPGLRHLPDPIAAAAPGRPEEPDPAALRQQRLGIQDFLGDFPAAELLHVFVAVAMVAYLMPLFHNSLCLRRIFLDSVAAEQKGGPGSPLLQAIQKAAGIASRGAVVKGQHHIFPRRPGPYREHQQAQAAQNCQQSPQAPHILFFHLTFWEKWGKIIQKRKKNLYGFDLSHLRPAAPAGGKAAFLPKGPQL